MRRDSNARGERETSGWPTMIKMKVLGVPSKPLSWSVIMLQYVSPSPTYLSLSRRCHVKLAGSVTPPAQPGQIALITPDTLTREIQVNLTYLQTCNLDLLGSYGHTKFRYLLNAKKKNDSDISMLCGLWLLLPFLFQSDVLPVISFAL